MMDNTLLELLRSVDTPTVCNAIEVAQGQRGFTTSPAEHYCHLHLNTLFRWVAPSVPATASFT